MSGPQIVVDTNVLVAGLRSNQGASFRLLSLVGTGCFEVNLSVPLVLEYEEVSMRLVETTPLTNSDVDAVIDYLCKAGTHWPIYYLWRPVLRDPKDDMVLELAVASGSEFIVTYNTRDFAGIRKFGVKARTAKRFLEHIGALP